MPIDAHPNRRPPTPEQVIAEQRRTSARPRSAPPKAAVPAVARAAPPPAAIPPDGRNTVEKYIDEISNPMIAHRRIKFDKNGVYVTADDGEPIPETVDFLVLCGETQIQMIKFGPEGTPPEVISGLLYENFVLPERSTLGDTDPAQWPLGLSGTPVDPWQHMINLVLQRTDTKELFCFSTSSVTGRRAVGGLLRHYDRMRRTNPDDVPVVRLKPGGFQHKDSRVGWVATPSFQINGKAPRDSGAMPNTSVEHDLNDEIPGL
jgi:hypothetical protein